MSDDWAFARGAIWFANGNGIHYSKWASMPQLGQWIWSAPFLWVANVVPHFALRVSVIVLSWLGLVSFYALLRQEKMSAQLAGFASCVLAMNPLFFVSQGTYMTDVPALSFGLIALNAYARAISQRDFRWLLLAVIVALLGVTTRQTLIAVPLVAGLLLFVRFPKLRFQPIWILSVALPVLVCLVTSYWFAQRTDITPMQLNLRAKALLFRPFLALHWCGLLVLPLCWLNWRERSWTIYGAALVAMLLGASAVFHWGNSLPYGGIFPYSAGMLSPWGTNADGLMLGERSIVLSQTLRIVLTILGCVGGAEILAALMASVRGRALPGLLALFTALQFLLLLLLPPTMDRYFEVLFPGALALLVIRGTEWNFQLPRMLAVLFSGLIAVALMHDWLAWNAARWELGRQAVANKLIAPTDIEGGFEWDGWFTSADPQRPLANPERTQPANETAGLNLLLSRYYFPAVNGRYALSFSKLPESEIIGARSYQLWLPPHRKDLLLLEFRPVKP